MVTKTLNEWLEQYQSEDRIVYVNFKNGKYFYGKILSIDIESKTFVIQNDKDKSREAILSFDGIWSLNSSNPKEKSIKGKTVDLTPEDFDDSEYTKKEKDRVKELRERKPVAERYPDTSKSN